MKKSVCIGVLFSRLRVEEKWILAALERRGISYDRLDDREIYFDIHKPDPWQKYDIVLERSIGYTAGLNALKVLDSWGIPTVNTLHAAQVCGDKLASSAALAKAGVPQPRCLIALSPDAALSAIEKLGYPVVLKPVVGSWGRLLAKINDRDAAESLIEHKSTLGSVQHSIFYIQEYVKKPGRDIRAFVVGDKVITAIYRKSSHWITNTARGAEGEVFRVGPDLEEICHKAAHAVGGGVLAVDVIEHPERGYLVNEINHTMEFHTTQPASGIDIADLIVGYTLDVAMGNQI
jgi:[lysine-biosynthesis-protein LysW]---L-2-aminoadipate ligase